MSAPEQTPPEASDELVEVSDEEKAQLAREWAEFAPMIDRRRAEYEARRAAEELEPAEPEPEEPRVVSAGHLIDKWLADILAEAEANKAKHATCTERWCSWCGRIACSICGDAPIRHEHASECLTCALTRAIELAGIPARYADALGRTSERVRSVAARRRAARASGIGPRVYEGVRAGLGKTTLAAACVALELRRAIERGESIDVLWTSTIALTQARRRHPLGSEDEAELIERAIEAELLVLDDLGAEHTRDGVVIEEILHARHDANRSTWITTSLTGEEIATRYSGGIARRIYEGATIIDCAEGL